MIRTPFAVYRKFHLVIEWYGVDYTFKRAEKDSYGEPTGIFKTVQVVSGIYHASQQSFIELVNVDGTSVKAKINKGIVCDGKDQLKIQQGDQVEILGVTYQVTAIQPIIYGNEAVAWEISIEELVQQEG